MKEDVFARSPNKESWPAKRSNLDDFVKSPSAALRFNFVVAVPEGRGSGTSLLSFCAPSPALAGELFTKSSFINLTSYLFEFMRLPSRCGPCNDATPNFLHGHQAWFFWHFVPDRPGLLSKGGGHMKRILPILFVVGWVALLLSPGAVRAADVYPSRTIQMIVPFPPGGVADLVARPVAAGLEKQLERRWPWSTSPALPARWECSPRR